jgi:hypothetical protein
VRLALHILGTEVLAFSIGEPDDADEWVDCGTTTSTPVGFTRAEVPWEDAGSLHQFEPDE